MENKFRVWHKERKTMTYNITLSIIKKEAEFELRGRAEEYEWMQFIGLKDTNLKDVYDSDVIRIYWDSEEGYTDEVISYDFDYAYWKYGNNPICELFDPKKEFEVIGNIYQP